MIAPRPVNHSAVDGRKAPAGQAGCWIGQTPGALFWGVMPAASQGPNALGESVGANTITGIDTRDAFGQIERGLSALEALLNVNRDFLLHRIVEAWLTGQREADGANGPARGSDGEH